MDMDMDMDLGWCLSCSKRTRDQRSPYCSDVCRQRDLKPETRVNEKQAITSPLPAKFLPLPPTSVNGSRQPSDHRPKSHRNERPEPSPRVCGDRVHSDETAVAPRGRHQQQRDRRAFSFPTSEENERPALPFVRKAKAVNGAPRSFKKQLYLSTDASKNSFSTGANTPNLESAFESTSDSSNGNELAVPAPRHSPVAPMSALLPTAPLTRSHQGIPPVASPSLSSPLQTARPSLDTRNPISRMGSSSRSREDIMSWALGVGADSSPSLHGDSDDDNATRGRSSRNRPRARRPLTLANLPPPDTESLDEPCHGSTPKGSVGALGGLHMTFTPVVDAIRRVSVAALTAEPSTSSLGLNPVPAPAEVSLVDVIVATRKDTGPRPQFEGDTPTLSTMSLSEALDPSTSTDLGETMESTTDDFSVVSSSIGRRASFSPRALGAQIPNDSAPTAPAAAPQRRRSSLRPIQTTASAIWNLSSYIRSLTPFAVPTSLVTPFSTSQGDLIPTSNVAEAKSGGYTVAAPEPSHMASPMPTTALQAHLDAALEDSLHEHDLVRSVPMDIMITSKTAALCEERQREREALEMIKQGASSRTRTPVRDDTRSPSNGPDPSSGRPQSYDDDRDDDRRDRDRGRGRGRARGRAPTPPELENEERRGRRRDRYTESRDRSWSAARGRRPSRSRAALLAAFVGAD